MAWSFADYTTQGSCHDSFISVVLTQLGVLEQAATISGRRLWRNQAYRHSKANNSPLIKRRSIPVRFGDCIELFFQLDGS